MENNKALRMHCPNCKKEMDFVRVVEAHVQKAPFTMNTPIGSRIHRRVEETSLPLAYCPDPKCKTVLYVGPSAEEVRDKFDEEQQKNRLDGC